MDINPLLLNMFANIFSQSVIYVVFSHIKFSKKFVCSICQSFALWLLGSVLRVKRPLPLILFYLFKYFDNKFCFSHWCFQLSGNFVFMHSMT